MANKELRYWKKTAHDAFDQLWKRKAKQEKLKRNDARKIAYKWLAGALGIENIGRDCHIGKFDVDRCKKTVQACLPYITKED